MPDDQFVDFAVRDPSRPLCTLGRLADTSRLIHETYTSLNDRNSNNTLMQAPHTHTHTMTFWGLPTRQTTRHPNRQHYAEQTLTLSLPTNTADPDHLLLHEAQSTQAPSISNHLGPNLKLPTGSWEKGFLRSDTSTTFARAYPTTEPIQPRRPR